jgi:hypothetical protein
MTRSSRTHAPLHVMLSQLPAQRPDRPIRTTLGLETMPSGFGTPHRARPHTTVGLCTLGDDVVNRVLGVHALALGRRTSVRVMSAMADRSVKWSTHTHGTLPGPETLKDVGPTTEHVNADDQEFQFVHLRRLHLAATTVRAIAGGLVVPVHH